MPTLSILYRHSLFNWRLSRQIYISFREKSMLRKIFSVANKNVQLIWRRYDRKTGNVYFGVSTASTIPSACSSRAIILLLSGARYTYPATTFCLHFSAIRLRRIRAAATAAAAGPRASPDWIDPISSARLLFIMVYPRIYAGAAHALFPEVSSYTVQSADRSILASPFCENFGTGETRRRIVII